MNAQPHAAHQDDHDDRRAMLATDDGMPEPPADDQDDDAWTAHAAADPHCTCNDCMAAYIGDQDQDQDTTDQDPRRI